MRKFGILLVIVALCMAAADISKVARPFDNDQLVPRLGQMTPAGRGVIAAIGDSRSLMGPQGKNIAVSNDGNTIAVLYGPPSDPYDPNDPFGGVWVAYSTDRGANWSTYGPHSTISPFRRMYCGLAGGEDFANTAGTLFFTWQESPTGYATCNNMTMIEENVPSAPSFSSPYTLSTTIMGWMPCIGTLPDNYSHVMATAWSYNNGGDRVTYAWISTDGGYAWTDTITVCGPVGPACYNGSGHFSFGTGGYGLFTWQDTLGAAAQYPFYVETTDGGFTWGAPTPLPAITQTQFWWTEETDLIIQDKPFVLHNDIGAGGTMQLFYPDPSNPGTPGAWNWYALDVDIVGTDSFLFQDTTWVIQAIQYPSISYEPNKNIILVSYKCNFIISPPPAGWVDGNYLGGIVSYDNGVSWKVCRPMSSTDQTTFGGDESADRLCSFGETTYVYSCWEDAGDGVIGNQYFELGIVRTVDYVNSIGENGNITPVTVNNLSVSPTVNHGTFRAAFTMPNAGNVSLRVFDISGRLVTTAFNGNVGKGDQTIDLHASNLATGAYILRLDSPSKTETAKFIITH